MQDLLIHGNKKDLGGFSVYRALPVAHRRNIGPFVFVDHMGPMQVDSTHKLDVRPHPHIGLATVTYLYEGKGYHRDSLGSKQIISSGDLNWMTAGKGIVHSERSPEGDASKTIHGMQIWVALPLSEEDCEPSFTHWPKEKLPRFSFSKSISAKLLIGEYQNQKSPVKALSPTLFMDLQCRTEVNEEVSFFEKEIGFFVAAGEGKINGQSVMTNDLFIPINPQKIQIEFSEGAKIIVVGGEPHPEPRYIWWNFVSSSKEKIRKAAEVWKNQQFGHVEGETDFIPLPEIPLP